MTKLSMWRKAWALLDARERRNALIVLGVVIVAAFLEAVMVGSLLPFLSVLSNPDMIEETRLLSWTYAALGFRSSYSFLIALGLVSLAAIVTANLVQICRTYLVSRFTMMRMHTISHRLLAVYLRQPYEFFLNRHSGDMAKGILAESGQVVLQFFCPAADLITSTLTVVAIIALLLWVDPLVATASLLTLGGTYGVAYFASRAFIKRLGRGRVDADAERYRIANEALGGIKDIKVLGREATYVGRYQKPSALMARSQVKVTVISEFPRYVVQSLAFCGIILLCIVLTDAANFQSGNTLGGVLPALGVYAFAGQRLMPALQKVYADVTRLRYGASAVDSVHDDLFRNTGTADLPRHPPQALGLRKQLRLDGVTYRYPNAEAGVRGISLTIESGEKIGIVGSTGAGKTTLVDVVVGLLRPKAGALVVDGTPITDDNLRAWQQSVGYVPQDVFLIDASIAENIALGVAMGELDHDRIRTCARLAQLDAFITSELPEGYATAIGERGVRLSGGQRQRIGIARALYRDADLIVFDEATSALDNLTEREVMAAIGVLPGDKTILVIAHRLSTVRICDRILVLERGRVVGLGSWDELVETNLPFRKLAQIVEAA